MQFTSVDYEENPAYVERRKPGVGVNFICFNTHRNGTRNIRHFERQSTISSIVKKQAINISKTMVQSHLTITLKNPFHLKTS